MKKVILFNFMLLALTSLKVLAQSDDQATKPVKNGDEWQMPKDVLLRARNFSEGLQKSLGLDEATTKKIFNAYLGNTKSVDEIRMGQGSEREKKEALAANQAKFDQTLKGILSPAQFDNYIKSRKTGKDAATLTQLNKDWIGSYVTRDTVVLGRIFAELRKQTTKCQRSGPVTWTCMKKGRGDGTPWLRRWLC